MLGSKSHFFKNSDEFLILSRNKMRRYLSDNNYSPDQISVYQKAFYFFCENPDLFDGATIVKDLHHIPGLDLNAMLHDYQYLNYKCACNLYMKWYCDLLYAKEMEKMGKGFTAWVYWSLLKLSGIPFCIYSLVKKGSPSVSNEYDFFKDYNCLTKKFYLSKNNNINKIMGASPKPKPRPSTSTLKPRVKK